VDVRFIVSTSARQRLASTSSQPRRDTVSPLLPPIHPPQRPIQHACEGDP
jgi:hypothetical protein